ncbi:MAG: DegV family protein [Clostridia bacterium]|nr:DegV family protein [Clostridia bacterium]
MSHSYILSCCSTADLSKEHLESRDISYVCFHYTMDGKDYPDDLGQTIAFKDFYQAMRDGADTQTSQVNISEYLNYFTSLLETGKDVLHVSLSSGISGSVNSARNAAAIAAERFPDRKIYVVDSLAASSGFGLIMDKLADMRDDGADIDEVYQWVEENKKRLHHWFFTSDLTFFVKGGRVSKAAGFFGGLLGVCPLLNVDHQGRLVPRSKIRGKQNVIREIVERMAQFADGGEQYADKCYMCNSDCYEDAKAVADLVEARFPNLKGKVLINDIGTTIGSHTGPGTVALFFWGEERKD